MLYAFKKKNESNERLINRFKKLVQRSRIIIDGKKKRFHIPTITQREIRKAAIIAAGHRARRALEQYYS
ncbi:30S ribosomal protein S21 [Candidatus Peregrinibacteria bacterium]|nr:30S ribosomal protein S21 [Candidatus Peregrinibacteria bacterium]